MLRLFSNRLLELDHVRAPAAEALRDPAMALLYRHGNVRRRVESIAERDDDALDALVAATGTPAFARNRVSAVAGGPGHFDLTTAEPIPLSGAAAAFLRDRRNADRAHRLFVHSVPLGGSRIRPDGTVDLGGGNLVRLLHPRWRERADGTVLLSRLARTERRHALSGDRLQLHVLQPDDRLRLVVPGHGRSRVCGVDRLNPYVGGITFALTHRWFATGLDMLAGPDGARWDTGSAAFRRARDERVFAAHPELRTPARLLGVATTIGGAARAAQCVLGPGAVPDAPFPS